MFMAQILFSLARRLAPPERQDWLKAMQAEHEALGVGDLRWAAGCLTVAIGWRLRKDGVYIALVCAAIWFLAVTPFFVLEAHVMPLELWNIGLFPTLVYMAAFCFVLGVYRPRLVVLSALALVIYNDVYGAIELYVWIQNDPGIHGMPEFHNQTFWAFLQDLHPHNARLLIGWLAHLGACLGGGLAGRWLAQRLRPRATR